VDGLLLFPSKLPSQKLSLAMGNWLSKTEVEEEEDEEIFIGP